MGNDKYDIQEVDSSILNLIKKDHLLKWSFLSH